MKHALAYARDPNAPAISARLGSPPGNHVLGEDLASERRGLQRYRLDFGHYFAIDVRLWNLAVFNRKKRLAGLAVEDEHVAGLSDLRNRVDQTTVAPHCHEVRRRGNVAVPNVMLDELKMPDALAGIRIEGKKGVGEQIVANSVGSVEIESRSASGSKY